MKISLGSELPTVFPHQPACQRALRPPKRRCRGVAQFLILLAFILAVTSLRSRGADSELPTTPAVKTEETNSLETLRSYLQLQEQLHATQLAIEENRKEATAAAARNAEALANRLQAIEQSLVAQRTRELEAMQSSNRLMLMVAGGIALLGLTAMMLMAYSHWRAMNRLADIATAFPPSRGLGGATPLTALGPGDAEVVSVGPGPTEQSNGRLLGAIDRLEKRIYELEHTTQSSVKEKAGEEVKSESPNGNGEASSAEGKLETGSIGMLLGKGQTLLNLDKVEEALACFEQILVLAPDHPEALVKKGSVLERLRRLDEAIECYDRAISKDSSMTIAYLHKGGLFNRMARYNEALDCYEKALQTQERR
jgi:tetratricopeptide (TPR) repeat protein